MTSASSSWRTNDVTWLENDGRLVEAELACRRHIDGVAAALPRDHRALLVAQASLAANLTLQQRFDEVLALIDPALAAWELAPQLRRIDHALAAALAAAETARGLSLQHLGRDQAAIPCFQRAMHMHDLTNASDPEDAVVAVLGLVTAAGFDADLNPDALGIWVTPYLDSLDAQWRWRGAELLLVLADCQEVRGDNAKALQLATRAIAMTTVPEGMGAMTDAAAKVRSMAVTALLNLVTSGDPLSGNDQSQRA